MRKKIKGALVIFAFALGPAYAQVQTDDAPPTHETVVPRGGRVGWARLITANGHWKRHARSDSVLSDFIRTQTSLNMDTTWYAADPADLKQLSAYPVIFSNGIETVTDPQSLKNIGEYLKRGGFLLIDACINPWVTPDPDQFLAENTMLMTHILPGVTIRELPNDHDIFSSFFTMDIRPPHTRGPRFRTDWDRWERHGILGVYDGDRLVATITVSGLQCGWDGFGQTHQAEICMQMIVNIYVYAMTQ
ncbi:MAG TPA: DUF4159 domain-containing protein [Opitutaceae bacterium]|nr:DUF4159 domain-containing protein [Opitutaceae bacterium]